MENKGRLEAAFRTAIATKPAKSLREVLYLAERSARESVSGGSVRAMSGNGHSVEFAGFGPGQMTPLEIATCYRELLEAFDQSGSWLRQCAKYGLDPFVAEMTPQTPDGTALPSGERVVLDDTGRFEELCAVYSVSTADVIDTLVGDKAIYLWMMYHLVPIREASSDYTALRTQTGGAL